MNTFPFALNDQFNRADFDLVASIQAGIDDSFALFDALATQLRFPDYFGRNWDALDECLSDLTWLPETKIALVHVAVPHLARRELVIYLEILLNAVDALREEGRTLLVAFPEQTRALRDVLSGVKR